MDQLPRRIVEGFGSLSPARKALLAATGGGALALALLLYSWSSQANFVPLYSGLDQSDSGRIVDQLRSRGVSFELSASGATVSVPQSEVDELRLDFAAQGLPEGGNIGFELFDGNGFTATDFVQRLNFQRGLQGELARTIETFSAVESARVHIVLPERSLFVSDQRPATASVVLRLRPGGGLSTSEVAAVAHLVSGAVEGLEKASITIVDTSGAVLYDGAQVTANGGIGLGLDRLEMQRNYEQAIERDVQALLDRSIGAGHSVVQVRATLNFDRVETETEAFAPDTEGQGVVRSSTAVTESYSTDGGELLGAVPGAVANVPGANTSLPTPVADATDSTEGGTGTSYVRTESVSNFEIGRTVTRNVQAPGDVERLSVSLLLDESVTAEQATTLSDAVAAAVGIDKSRGDTIVLGQLPFDRSAITAAEAAFASEASQQQLLGYARMGLPAIVLLIAFFFFRLLMRSVSKRVSYQATEATAGSALAAGAPIALPAGRRAAAALPQPTEQQDTRSEVEQRVTSMAQNQPDAVAQVVQAWLRDE